MQSDKEEREAAQPLGLIPGRADSMKKMTPLFDDPRVLIGRRKLRKGRLVYEVAIGLFLESRHVVVNHPRLTLSVTGEPMPDEIRTGSFNYSSFVNALGGHSIFIQTGPETVVYPDGHGVYLGNVNVRWERKPPQFIKLDIGYQTDQYGSAMMRFDIDWRPARVNVLQLLAWPFNAAYWGVMGLARRVGEAL